MIKTFFKNLFKKTKQRFHSALLNLIGKGLDSETIESLEELLYEANFGISLTEYLRFGSRPRMRPKRGCRSYLFMIR